MATHDFDWGQEAPLPKPDLAVLKDVNGQKVGLVGLPKGEEADSARIAEDIARLKGSGADTIHVVTHHNLDDPKLKELAMNNPGLGVISTSW